MDMGHLSKLINIMQLIIEYFLYCQEQQYKALNALKGKATQWSKQKHGYDKKFIEMNEAVQGYEHQLKYLKELVQLLTCSSLSSEESGLDYNDTHHQIQQVLNHLQNPSSETSTSKNVNALVTVPSSSQQQSVNSMAYLNSILSSERETRESIVQVFENQKTQFMQEIGNILHVYFDKTDKKDQTDFTNMVIQHDAKRSHEKLLDRMDELYKCIQDHQYNKSSLDSNKENQQNNSSNMQGIFTVKQNKRRVYNNSTFSAVDDNDDNTNDNDNANANDENETKAPSIAVAVSLASANMKLNELSNRLVEKDRELKVTRNDLRQQERYLQSQIEELTDINKKQAAYIDHNENRHYRSKMFAVRMIKSTLQKGLCIIGCIL